MVIGKVELITTLMMIGENKIINVNHHVSSDNKQSKFLHLFLYFRAGTTPVFVDWSRLTSTRLSLRHQRVECASRPQPAATLQRQRQTSIASDADQASVHKY